MKIVVKNTNEIINEFIKRISDSPGWVGVDNINPESRNGFGKYLMHAAAEMDAVEVIAALLSLGANIEQEGEHRNTPLQEAVASESYKTAVFLLMSGADFKKTNDAGLSAWDLFLVNCPTLNALIEKDA
jgi:hypothetical protein